MTSGKSVKLETSLDLNTYLSQLIFVILRPVLYHSDAKDLLTFVRKALKKIETPDDLNSSKKVYNWCVVDIRCKLYIQFKQNCN